jgi:membrane associated rhomboid family serine protease
MREGSARHAWVRSLLPALAVPGLVLAVSLIQLILLPGLDRLGIAPRYLEGLIGVITAPLLHRDGAHLAANLLPLTLLTIVAAQLYPSFWRAALGWVWLAGGGLVWLLARPGLHLGASGLVFGLTALLLVGGILRRERGAMTAALLALFLNQGLIWGMIPINSGVSWEAHAYSFGVGAVAAWVFRAQDRPPDEPEEAIEDPGPVGDAWNYRKFVARPDEP